MTKEQLEKFRIKLPLNLEYEGCENHEEDDEYGHYSTGDFIFGDKVIVITYEDLKEGKRWHLSVSTKKRIPTYEEMKDIRYKFLPNRIHTAEIMPPREEFVNIHPYCRHLWEIDKVGKG